MKVLGIVCVLALAVSGTVEAKPKKPVVCMSFTEVKDVGAVCRDGKRPVILTSYTIVTAKSEDGAPIRVAVGYR